MSKRRELDRLYHKLVNNPFFPLLFISEVAKVVAVSGLSDSSLIPLSALAIASTVMWILSDEIEEKVGEATDEIGDS